MKQLLDNPWENLTERYPAGTVVEGRVRNLTDFGAFIEIEDGIDGLVHVSNLSWTKRVKHPSEIVKKGEKVKAVVLGVEPQNRRLSLGIKQLQPDVWESFFAAHRVGDVVHGKVLRTAQFGAFVEIAEGVEGLCHISEAGDEPAAVQAGNRPGARIQDHQDQRGREEGRPQPARDWPRSQSRPGRELQEGGPQGSRLQLYHHSWRPHQLEERAVDAPPKANAKRPPQRPEGMAALH